MAIIGKLLKTAGAGYAGYGADKSRIAGEEIQRNQLARQQKQDAIAAAIAERQAKRPELIASLFPKAKAGDTNAQGLLIGEEAAKVGDFDTPAPERPQLVLGADGTYVPANVRTGMGPDGQPVKAFRPPEKAEKPDLIPVPQPGGGSVLTPKTAGLVIPEEAAHETTAMVKARAANVAQLSVIDDALKELEAHPDAVGITRGLPVVGNLLDPRINPEGDAARAQIANVGSLKLHDRSGAAVGVKEFPRLAPFIPAINDPPATIRTKLQKLRQALMAEIDAMGGSNAPGSAGPPVDSEFEALMTKYAKKPPV